jgi:RluA family pseudouridine synthase
VTDDNIRTREFEVGQKFDGWRLDRFLAARLSRISRTRAAEIASLGDIEIQPPRRPKASLRLRASDVVVLREHLEPEIVQDDEVRVLYEDDHLIVVDKPPGMLVHEVSTVRLNTIQGYLHRQGLQQAEPTHRIDRETSGVLVCAKNKEMVKRMRGIFATDHPQKLYRTLVLDPQRRWSVGQRLTLDTPLGFCPESRLRIRMNRGTLKAVTHIEVLQHLHLSGYHMADLQARIETGRQHQIRIHLALHGTPVAGDKLYTYDDDFFTELIERLEDPKLLARLPFKRHALHASFIALPHPATNQTVQISAPLPSLWPAEKE